ncbi:MAG: hypothetical protein ACQEUN_17105 [Pseudomonadota bacterium]
MEMLFDHRGHHFEPLSVGPPVSVPLDRVNGSAIFCRWPDEPGVGHSRFSFDDAVADRLFAEKYHHTLIANIDQAISQRQRQGTEPSGGALLYFEQGLPSICWVSLQEAERLKALSQHAEAVEELQTAYLEALQRADLEHLAGGIEGLSGVFLPCPAPAYFESHPRVMVVGQETRGWRNDACRLRAPHGVNAAEVAESMRCSQAFAAQGARRSRFMQFYRKVSRQVAPGQADAAVWSNQFCMSFRSGSPERLPEAAFQAVETLSHELLRAQFEILQPQAVIFTTGPGRDKYLKACFPAYETVEVMEPRRLWHFKVGDTQCVRTSHPRWVKGTEYLDRAIEGLSGEWWARLRREL